MSNETHAHADPDFRDLPVPTLRLIERAIVGAVAPPGGLVPAQYRLLRAVGTGLLGVDLDPRSVEPASPAELAAALAHQPERLRHRVVQLMVMLELILHPLPEEVAERVAGYAAALEVDDGMLDVARDYAQGAYGLALKDLERNGYFRDWDHHGAVEAKMHVHRHLTSPFEVDDHDPELLAEWQALERCAPGTLGRALWEYYVGRGFVFPGSEGSVSPVLAQHDWIHVLADYGTVVDSELEVFGFIAAADPEPKGFSWLATVLGLFETGYVPKAAGDVLEADPGHMSDPGMCTRLADALRRGRLVDRDLVGGVDYFELVDLPIEEARARLGIVPKSDAAVAAGSAGVFEPAGISDYQREHGDPRHQPPRLA